MGRIKAVYIKRITKRLLNEHSGEFTADCNKNKDVLKKYTKIVSPKIRNAIAGYAARLVKQSIENKERKVVSSEDLSKFY
ncbi:30S ribosomal protein S17e [Candidatus Woesearchaeota archaeon]|nr:30S ribosomal protein S17e [Candidatus Woesearchaeota archaeon]